MVFMMMYFSCFFVFFFFKQKTAYELRISDWSSDVCSSDLSPPRYFSMVFALAGDSTMTSFITFPAWILTRARRLEREMGRRQAVSDTRPPAWRSSPDRKSTRLNSSH